MFHGNRSSGLRRKACAYGCMGYGSCVKACQFDAIHVVDGVAVVDKEKCVACGKVLWLPARRTDRACSLQRQSILYSALPTTRDRLSRRSAPLAVSDVPCVPNSVEFDAIHMENNVAVIDYEKCTNCGKCAAKCPAKGNPVSCGEYET